MWGIQIDQLCPNQVGQSPSEGKAMVAEPDWDEDGLQSMMTIILQGDDDDDDDYSDYDDDDFWWRIWQLMKG